MVAFLEQSKMIDENMQVEISTQGKAQLHLR